MQLKTTITLGEKELKEIVTEFLENKGYVIKGEIRINIGTECVGYGTAERNEAVFKGITVDVES